MKNALVLGGSRFIGYHLTQELLRQGMEVSHFRRGQTHPPARFAREVRVFRGDRDRAEDLRGVFTCPYEFVFDLSGYYLRQVAPLLAEHSGKIGHYLFCSTSSVLSVPPPIPYNEESPTTRADDAYGGRKRSIELSLLEAAREKGLSITILRPQAVLGLYDGAQAAQAFEFLKSGGGADLPTRLAQARINLVDVNDLVQAFTKAAGNPVSFGRIYNVANDESVSLVEFLAICAKVAGLPLTRKNGAHLNGAPAWWHDYDLVADNARIKRELSVSFRPLQSTIETCWSEFRRRRWRKALAAHVQKFLVRF